MLFNQGEIYWYTGDPKHRPIVIVSREIFNRGKYVVVVPLTGSKFETRSKLPNCVSFRAGRFGIERDCVAQAEAIAQIPVTDLDLQTGSVGRVDEHTLSALVGAILFVVSEDA